VEWYTTNSRSILGETTGSVVIKNSVELKAWMIEMTVAEVEILTVDPYNEVWQRAQI
jgi:hypothetical protein